VEGGGHDAAFLDQSGSVGVFGQDLDVGRDGVDYGSTDEDHLEGFRLEFAWGEENVAGYLTAVGVAEDCHIEEAERILGGVFDVGGEEDGSGAGAEDSVAGGGEFFDGVGKAFFLEELQLGGGFAAGKN
jgi:hypothetical protein